MFRLNMVAKIILNIYDLHKEQNDLHKEVI